MTYWQENYAFIKDVYDSRSSKLEELMEKTDNAISAVLADKIYTSNEFKKIQEAFMVRWYDENFSFKKKIGFNGSNFVKTY